eukprot:PLAT14451.1.p1 GENE.PLAT14451.1~~PLAT14451.1.p1  ORF type:complete len:144 (-),score=50.91 PLAT14451.1:120-503(-)
MRLLLALLLLVACAFASELSTEALACLKKMADMPSYDKLNALGHAWNALPTEHRSNTLATIAALEKTDVPPTVLAQIAAQNDSPDPAVKADDCFSSLLLKHPERAWASLTTEEKADALLEIESALYD